MPSPTLKLNNGVHIPILGFGTWQSDPGVVGQSVKDAIDSGYRHIDGARCYQNEPEVGAGYKAKIDDGTVKREDLYIVSKLWDTHHHQENVIPALKKTLSDLGLTYLDLYLIHWPISFKVSDELCPEDENGYPLYADEVDLADTWKKMEEAVRLGLVKSIGVSNFNSKQIEHILKSCTIKPVTNQIEVHPYFPQHKLVEFCKSKDISVTAYSPFASPNHPARKPGDPVLLEEPKLIEIGKKYGKRPSHVILRWLIQRNLIVIPKSVTKNRIVDNFNVFDFVLSAEDIKIIDSLDKGAAGRINAELMFKESKGWPFGIEF